MLGGVNYMAKKIIKVSDHYIKDNEEWFKNINFSDPIEVTHGFGE